MNRLSALLSGLVFGLGLLLSGMTNPDKVLGFLDITGLWDPSLAFVMGGALSVTTVVFAIARRRNVLPTATHSARIDRRLVSGAVLFGIGWGLVGICPGPAIVLLGTGSAKGWIFALGLIAGMALFELIGNRSGKAPPQPPAKIPN